MDDNLKDSSDYINQDYTSQVSYLCTENNDYKMEPGISKEIITETSTEKKQKMISFKSVAILLIVCMVISSFSGIIGYSIISNYFNDNTDKLTTTDINSTSDTQDTDELTENSELKIDNQSTDTASTSSLSVSQIAEKAADSIVEITTETVVTSTFMQQYVSEGAGSGVIISTDGYIATNNHVIADASNITVKLRNGTEYTSTLIGTDSESDIALIKIDATDLTAAIFGDSSKLVVGELAVAIGNPLGSLGGTVTDGIISALDRTIEIDNVEMTLLQTNAAINPGNSGGGLFNEFGELIGIVNAKSSGTGIEGLGFAIPINIAKNVINSIYEFGYVRGRIDDGIDVIDITDTATAWSYRVSTLGLYILSVDEGSNAEDAGIKSGDRIISVNGTDISSSDDYSKVLNELSIGDNIEMKLSRNGKEITKNFELEEKKA